MLDAMKDAFPSRYIALQHRTTEHFHTIQIGRAYINLTKKEYEMYQMAGPYNRDSLWHLYWYGDIDNPAYTDYA